MNRSKYSHIEFTVKDENGLQSKILEPINTLTIIKRSDGEVVCFVPDEHDTYAKFNPLEPYEYFRTILTGAPVPRPLSAAQEHPTMYPPPPDEDPEAYPVEELPGKAPEPRG